MWFFPRKNKRRNAFRPDQGFADKNLGFSRKHLKEITETDPWNLPSVSFFRKTQPKKHDRPLSFPRERLLDYPSLEPDEDLSGNENNESKRNQSPVDEPIPSPIPSLDSFGPVLPSSQDQLTNESIQNLDSKATQVSFDPEKFDLNQRLFDRENPHRNRQPTLVNQPPRQQEDKEGTRTRREKGEGEEIKDSLSNRLPQDSDLNSDLKKKKTNASNASTPSSISEQGTALTKKRKTSGPFMNLSRLMFISGLILIALGFILIFFGSRSPISSEDDLPVIEAPKEIKRKPDPGESPLIPYQDELIYGKLDENQSAPNDSNNFEKSSEQGYGRTLPPKKDIEEHLLPQTEFAPGLASDFASERDAESNDLPDAQEHENDSENRFNKEPKQKRSLSTASDEKSEKAEYLNYKDLTSSALKTEEPEKKALKKEQKEKSDQKSSTKKQEAKAESSQKAQNPKKEQPVKQVQKPAPKTNSKPNPKRASKSNQKPAPLSKQTFIPFGQFPTQESARQNIAKIRRAHPEFQRYPVSIKVERHNGQNTYRVLFGPIPSSQKRQ